MNIPSSKNIVAAEIDAQGNVIIGDGNTIVNLKEAAQYKALEASITSLNKRFERVQRRLEKYPNDSEIQEELLEIDDERNQRYRELSSLKQEVLKLAADFARILLNSERLSLAKQYFDAGAFKEARVVLDAETMSVELGALLAQKKDFIEKISENQRCLSDKANEYLILARLSLINFDSPNRFEQAKEYFEQSLKAERNQDNIFDYAMFLQEHNQFQEAQSLHEEVLSIFRKLAQTNQQAYLPKVAGTLNNLGVLHKKKNEFSLAEKAYQEALNIRRQLAQMNSELHLGEVADALNNLANLKRKTNEIESSEGYHYEALSIRRHLAQINPQKYLPDLAGTLNNLANLLKIKNEFTSSEANFKEALNIYRNLTEENPQIYLSYVALALNNLGELYRIQSQFSLAQLSFDEALGIYRGLVQTNPTRYLLFLAAVLNNIGEVKTALNENHLAKSSYTEALNFRRALAMGNPKTHLPDVSMTACNMSKFYCYNIPNKEKSLAYARETLKAALPFREELPSTKDYIQDILIVLQQWGLDGEKFLQEVMKA